MRNNLRLVRTVAKSTLNCVSFHIPSGTACYHSPAAVSSALQLHIKSHTPKYGQAIHSYILKSGFQPNTNISTKLLILHLKCSMLQYARQSFDEMQNPSLQAYSYMISGYFKLGLVKETLDLARMISFVNDRPYWFVLSMVLKLSASTCMLDIGKQVHTQIVKLCQEFDEVLFTALVDMYAKNGNLDYSKQIYEQFPLRNFVCSTVLITGYMNQRLIKAAEEVFNSIVEKDAVVFNAMIEGYSKSLNTSKNALEMYKEMQCFGFQPTMSTYASVMGACSLLSALEFGQQVHCQLVKRAFVSHVVTGSALVDMYCKCGNIDDARLVFNTTPQKNVISWTCIIDGYGKNGRPHEALEFFYSMCSDLTVKPNCVTFVSALSACAHAGLLLDGHDIFESMTRKYSILPRMEHYACMVDLMGRAGKLIEAFHFINQMPEKPNCDVWTALLGACRLHGNVELAAVAANEVFKLSNNRRPGAYVALSNTFAAVEKWESVNEVREWMKEKGVSKGTGQSWVGIDDGSFGFHLGEGA